MQESFRAVYRDGAFVSVVPCNLPEETPVEVVVGDSPRLIPPLESDPEERARIRKAWLRECRVIQFQPMPHGLVATNCMNAVDTNVLIYVHDLRDLRKQAIASDLVVSLSDGVLVWQVVCEFLSASRKLAPLGYNFDQAFDDIRALMPQWTTALPTWQNLDRAKSLLDRYSLSHWDALLIAACLEAGVTTIYSENFSGYAEMDGLKIVNPFGAAE